MPFRPKRSNTQSEADLAAIEKLNLNGPIGSSPLASAVAKGKENRVKVVDGGRGEVEDVKGEVVRGLEVKVNGV
jgi:hypothetical protein